MLDTPLTWSCAARNILKQLTVTLKARITGSIRRSITPRPTLAFEWDNRAPPFLPMWWSGNFETVTKEQLMLDYTTTRTTQTIVAREEPDPTIKMQIFVRTLLGRTILIQTEHPINVETLKSRIHDKEGIPEYLQRLTQKGKPLTNDQVLWSPDDSHYPTIHMNFNLDGGTPIMRRNPTGTRNALAAPQQLPRSPTHIPRLQHFSPAAPKQLPKTTTNWTFPLNTSGYVTEHNFRYCWYRQFFWLANENPD